MPPKKDSGELDYNRVILLEPKQWRSMPMPYDCPKCDERVSFGSDRDEFES